MATIASGTVVIVVQEKGLEISALAWLDITGNCAYGLSIEQTPPTGKATDRDDTRIDVYLDHLTRVVS